ncbi:MAG: hypothetical protein M1830_002195 [Pleopsidium flavum]|nr:MAG: hypothetical protein M1830_002195 [Pleopsidium flavum]
MAATRPPPPTSNPATADEEDDYMSMTITEPSAPKEKETYTQRRIRKQRESEAKSRPQPTTTASLASSALPPSNKGFQMLAKLGFTPGSTLGAPSNPNARAEPLGVVVKEDRGGVGLDSERKRKVREEMEGEAKRVRAEEGEYRERVGREREERRVAGLVLGAMRVVERFDCAAEEEEEGEVGGGGIGGEGGKGFEERRRVGKPTQRVNVLWRGLVRQREEKERERRMRYDLQQSFSRVATYDDPNEDQEDRQALGVEEEEIEEEDPELDEFNALEPAEQLRRLVDYLRETYRYCFWCKYQYPDASMDGCPGLTEEDHD